MNPLLLKLPGKAFIILLIVLLYFALQSQAQLLYGIRGGVNSSSVKYVPANIPYISLKSKRETGLNIGGIIKYRLSANIALQAEIQYCFKNVSAGLGYDPIVLTDTGIYTIKGGFGANLHYFQTPISVQYRYNLKNGIVLFSNIGLYGALKLKEVGGNGFTPISMSVKDNGDPYESRSLDMVTIEEKLYNPKFFQSADYGGVISLGVAFNLNDCDGIIAPEIRMTQSFLTNDNYAKLSSSLEFSIGYIAKFGK